MCSKNLLLLLNIQYSGIWQVPMGEIGEGEVTEVNAAWYVKVTYITSRPMPGQKIESSKVMFTSQD